MLKQSLFIVVLAVGLAAQSGAATLYENAAGITLINGTMTPLSLDTSFTLSDFQVGESVTLSVTVKYGTDVGNVISQDAQYNSSPGLNFGFQSSKSGVIYSSIDMSQTAHLDSWGSAFYSRSNNLNMSGYVDPQNTVLKLDSGYWAASSSFVTGTEYEFVLTVEKTADTTNPYTVSYFLDGALIHSLDTALTLDEEEIVSLGFRNYPTWYGGSIYLTNISVTTVPEPSTYVLLAFGIGAIGLLRRVRG
jgi:hypothetical protein